MLDRAPAVPPPMERQGGVAGGGPVENADQSYGSAVERLRSMLHSIPPAMADRSMGAARPGGPKTVLFGGRNAPRVLMLLNKH